MNRIGTFAKSFLAHDPVGEATSVEAPPSFILSGSVAFAFSVDDVLFATADEGGELYFHGRELFFDVPKGQTVDLLTGGAPLDAGSAPSEAAPDRNFQFLAVNASAEGAPARLRLFSYGRDGEVRCKERKLKTGRSRLKPDAADAAASRLCLTLSGAGRIAFASLRLVRGPEEAGEAGSERPPESCPLLQLIMPDYLAARKAGAEIPPPPLTTDV